jgi:RNA polymerase sigma factor (sigma-70 family)
MPTDPFIVSVLSAPSSEERQSAWCAFLDRYSGLIYHVVRSFDRDPDRSANCFLFACEQLSAGDFRRLRKFDQCGGATFSTWLCAVVRNLCIDWHRKENGRHRVFGLVGRRDATDQLLFEVVFRRGFSAVEAREELSRRGIELSFAAVEDRIWDLRRCLSSRQLWLLSSGNTMLDSLNGEEEGTYVVEPADPAPDPEALVALRETHQQVSAALASLTDSERLLVRLRYQEGLTLQQVARLVGLKDAQTADRRLRDIIDHLRQALGMEHLVRGKPKPASV